MKEKKKAIRQPRSTAQRAHGAQATGEAFPIVGIGASAGGLAAFEAFFAAIPAGSETGMAFVLVQHLAPDHKSILTDLIGRYTSMLVLEVEDGMVVRPDCTYIIPPNRDMALLNGRLQLMEPTAPRGQRLPIDFFFRSLAQDQRERAIAIVLSGTGSDGTQGVRAIKGEGGLVMAQRPASAEYEGMPCSAIATGLVDYELPPAEMFGQLKSYVAHAFGKHPPIIAAPVLTKENSLQKVFILLRSQTGHDFSQYKPSTIHRRIERRMALHQIETLEGYVKLMQQIPAEVERLFRDLLIGVTRFFRDPEAFQAIEEQAFPRLFADKPGDAAIRIWIPGCSTGEEAYSLAILLYERMETHKQAFHLQIFATDIDSRAIATARAGCYPAGIAADITPERLSRFFTIDTHSNTYRIHKSIRDLLIFSEQDVIKDPPFSKIDLISCRNLLIYLGAELQKKLLLLFHYALNPSGLLMLGTSETIGDMGDLFSVLDRKLKIYQRKQATQSAQRVVLNRLLLPTIPMNNKLPRTTNDPRPTPVKPPLRDLTEQAILQQIAPAAALVNRSGDILYLHGRTGMYLEPTPGEVGINNICKMAREGLQRDLVSALHQAAGKKERVRRTGLRVKTNGDYTCVNLTISPVATNGSELGEEHCFLVILEDAPHLAAEQRHPLTLPAIEGLEATEAETRIAALTQELLTKDAYLHTANEELEASNEELKSANEEMQSVNEELQSTNEELETSKEELQSVNEELSTVNTELQTKVVDLSQANNDMNNLLAGTGIGTIFVDHRLRILRFTPAATRIIKLIPSDVGRPVGDLAFTLVGYDRLVADIETVLSTLVHQEIEVQTAEGRWYAMRIQPYRTLENVIEGAVITFVDTTDLKTAQEALLRLAVVVQDAHDAITVQDLTGRILAWNPSAARLYGWSEAEALTMNIRDLIPETLREAAQAMIQQLSQAQRLEPYRTQRIAKDGSVVDVWVTATALVNKAGQIYAVATTERPDGLTG